MMSRKQLKWMRDAMNMIAELSVRAYGAKPYEVTVLLQKGEEILDTEFVVLTTRQPVGLGQML